MAAPGSLSDQSTVERKATSAFVSGFFPRRPGLVIGLSALVGFLLTVVWSAHFVDQVIGGTIADTLLGVDAAATPITGIGSGIAFAFVTGVAGTFTACNIAAFGAVAPMLGDSSTRWSRFTATLRPVGWLAVGMVAISAPYGALVGIIGTSMPQFDTAKSVPGELSARSVQSMIVFGVIGLIMIYIGLAAAGKVRDPFTRIAARFPNAPMVFMGVLIGGFLIGRPYPLFRQMFRDAAEARDPLYGAAAFVLQSLGNVLIMAVIFLVIAYGTGGRLQRWLAADPRRLAVLTASALIIAGVFTFLYWDIRLLARREIIPWYPVAPWAG